MAKKNAVTSARYREAMSHFAGAVNIAATDGPAGRRGVTVSAAVSISDDPATVLICLNRNRPENRMFEANGCFSLNTLCERHLDLARGFAGEGHLSMDDRFLMGEWLKLETGAPILNGARMAIDCKVTDVQAIHTHFVVIGEVVGFGPENREPALIYMDRGYKTL